MDSSLIYALTLFFFFYLLNYADITARPAQWLKQMLGPTLGYPLGCAFCWGWWVTAAFWAIGWAPLYLVFIAPVLHLFVDLVYTRLGGAQKPVSSGEPPLLPLDQRVLWDQISDAFYGTPKTPASTPDELAKMTKRALGKETPPLVNSNAITDLTDTVKMVDFSLFWGNGKEWGKPELIGKPVLVIGDNAWDPRGQGRVEKGRKGTLSKVGPVSAAWAYYVTASDGLDDFCVGSFSDLEFTP